MSENQTQAPEQISYTDQDVANFNRRDRHKEGWIRAEVVKATRMVAKTGTMGVKMDCAPLNSEGVACKPTAPLKIYVPFPNPNVEGHRAPNTSTNCRFFASSIDPKFPRYARKSDTPGKFFDPASGELVDLETKQAIAKEVDQATAKVASDWYNNPESLVGETFYAYVEHRKGTDGNVYPEITKTRLNAPEGVDILTENFKD